MEYNDNLDLSKRSEKIKLARESCHKNLNVYSGKNNESNKRNNVDSGIKSLGYNIAPKKKELRNSEQLVTTHYSNSVAMKLLMIRIVSAVIIFLFVVAIDQFKLTYNELNSNTIIEQINSNKEVTQIEDFFASLTKEKILSVFNRLDK